MKLIASACLIFFYVGLVTAQNRNRPARERRQKYGDDVPQEQGRTLGLLGPLLNLGASSLGGFGGLGGLGNFGGFGLGYDQPAAAYRPRPQAGLRPQSGARPQSDGYYGGGYGGYGGGYPSYGYGGYGYRPPTYGGYGGFFPQFAGYPSYSYGGYRPQAYPGVGGYGSGYPSSNSQRPGYGGPAAARPGIPANVGAAVGGAGSPATPSLSGLSGAQAAEVANILGQLLGQQLRPIINGATAADTPGDPPSALVEDAKRYY